MEAPPAVAEFCHLELSGCWRGPIGGKRPEGCEVLVGGAESDAEHHATAREVVERDHLTRELPGPPAGDWRDHRPDHEARRRLSDRPQHRPRRDHVGRLGPRPQEMIPEEEAVPAGILGELGERDDLGWVGERPEVRGGDGEATTRHGPPPRCQGASESVAGSRTVAKIRRLRPGFGGLARRGWTTATSSRTKPANSASSSHIAARL